MNNMTDLIREVLQTDINLPASEVCDAVFKRHNIKTTVQQVYNIRSFMKRKRSAVSNAARLTRTQNKLPLNEQILKTLRDNPNGLTDRQVADNVKTNGYVSRSDNFFEIVRSSLYKMVEKGSLIKNGPSYWIKPGVNLPKNEVRRNVKPVNQQLDATVLMAVADLVKKVGGANSLQPYIETISRING